MASATLRIAVRQRGRVALGVQLHPSTDMPCSWREGLANGSPMDTRGARQVFDRDGRARYIWAFAAAAASSIE